MNPLKPRTTIPFGPQHPVFPEPLQLKLSVVDEVVTEAIPVIGYVHRGLEKLVEIRDFHQMIQVVERVCGICSMMHAMCYCQGIETLMEIEIPLRSRFLRTVWAEVHRIQSHLLWLGLFADSFGFESLFMQLWRLREKILDINEATAGNRIIVSVNIIGGVRRDLDPESIRWILQELRDFEKAFIRLRPVLLSDYSVQKRTVEKGVLTAEKAKVLGVVGPTLRASGIAEDIRQLGYAAYDQLDFSPLSQSGGDCYSRLKVRFLEVLQSIELIRQALSKLPAGDIRTKVKGRPAGEIATRVEQPRGELLYYISADGAKLLKRLRIRAPSFANIPALQEMLSGVWLSDVAVIVLSIDPCISCTER